MAKDIRTKVGIARKNDNQIAILSMKNDEYKSRIKLAADNYDKECPEAGSMALLEKYKNQGSGEMRFFKNAGDAKKMTDSEALESKLSCTICGDLAACS